MKNISIMDTYDSYRVMHKHYTEDISISDIVKLTREFKKLWNEFCDAIDNDDVNQLELYAIRMFFCSVTENFDRHLPGLTEIESYDKRQLDPDGFIQVIYYENYLALQENDAEKLNELTAKYCKDIVDVLYAFGTYINVVYVIANWVNTYCYTKDHPEIFEASHYESENDYKEQVNYFNTVINNRPPKFMSEPEILTTVPFVVKNAYAYSNDFKNRCCSIWDTYVGAP